MISIRKAVLSAVGVVAACYAVGAPAPYPLRVNSRSAKAPNALAFAANQNVYRATFVDGSTASDVTGTVPFMTWSTNASASGYASASYSFVDSTNGIVDFTFAPTSVNYTAGTYIYEIGVKNAGTPSVYRQGEFIIRGSPIGTGVQVDFLSLINYVLYEYTNTASGPYRPGTGVTFATTNADGSVTIDVSLALTNSPVDTVNRVVLRDINMGGYSITNIGTNSLEFEDGNTISIDGSGFQFSTTVNGDGSGLTALNGSQVTSGTVADARIAGTIARDSELAAVTGANIDLVGTITSGVWQAGVIASNYLNRNAYNLTNGNPATFFGEGNLLLTGTATDSPVATLRNLTGGTEYGPWLRLEQGAGVGEPDFELGGIEYRGPNEDGTQTNWARIRCEIEDETASSESGKLYLDVMKSGTLTSYLLARESGIYIAQNTDITGTLQVNGQIDITPSASVALSLGGTGKYLSGDGDAEGLYIESDGDVVCTDEIRTDDRIIGQEIQTPAWSTYTINGDALDIMEGKTLKGRVMGIAQGEEGSMSDSGCMAVTAGRNFGNSGLAFVALCDEGNYAGRFRDSVAGYFRTQIEVESAYDVTSYGVIADTYSADAGGTYYGVFSQIQTTNTAANGCGLYVKVTGPTNRYCHFETSYIEVKDSDFSLHNVETAADTYLGGTEGDTTFGEDADGNYLAQNLLFRTAGTQRLDIASNGDVTIEESLTVGEDLTVSAGTVDMTGATLQGGNVYALNGATNYVYLDPAGDVTIRGNDPALTLIDNDGVTTYLENDASNLKINVDGAAVVNVTSSSVGIGTNSSSGETLHIVDTLRLQPVSTASVTNTGTMYYDSDDDKVKVWTGAAWENLN